MPKKQKISLSRLESFLKAQCDRLRTSMDAAEYKNYIIALLFLKRINDQDRIDAYNNYETTDDHGMVIYGKAKDQMGKEYFMVKNSWGEAGNYNGIWYASEAFVRYKTMNIIVHKDALPKDIKKKLGIK